MSLLDHFHPPLTPAYQWHAFHHTWCTFMAAGLNRSLPREYRAMPFAYRGIEVDVAAYFQRSSDQTPILREAATAPYVAMSAAEIPITNGHGGHDTAWQPPPPVQSFPFDLQTDSFEVLVYSDVAEPSLVGAVELVSPANKDRPSERQAFVTKCENYLRQGVGLVIVDIVTKGRVNLHGDLLSRLGAPPGEQHPSSLYATAYRPYQHAEITHLAYWQEILTIGQALPTMPLWLRHEFCAPLHLNETYLESCQALRIEVTAPVSDIYSTRS
ncbi:MAG: DUF4058 family protein [Caldilineaceae bacterium]